jgi:hypothetical protein
VTSGHYFSVLNISLALRPEGKFEKFLAKSWLRDDARSLTIDGNIGLYRYLCKHCWRVPSPGSEYCALGRWFPDCGMDLHCLLRNHLDVSLTRCFDYFRRRAGLSLLRVAFSNPLHHLRVRSQKQGRTDTPPSSRAKSCGSHLLKAPRSGSARRPRKREARLRHPRQMRKLRRRGGQRRKRLG